MFNHLVIGSGKKRACKEPDFIEGVLEDRGRKNYIIPKKQAELGVEMCMETQENSVTEVMLHVKNTQGTLYSQHFLKQE